MSDRVYIYCLLAVSLLFLLGGFAMTIMGAITHDHGLYPYAGVLVLIGVFGQGLIGLISRLSARIERLERS